MIDVLKEEVNKFHKESQETNTQTIEGNKLICSRPERKSRSNNENTNSEKSENEKFRNAVQELKRQETDYKR